MSQSKITLRPPPNVEFVQGYPGIPPGQERPQAEVKGIIELRFGKEGMKSKWVRVELRKVEVLPTGGAANTFYDFIGPSPFDVWRATNEYDILTTRDFQFRLRIPETIPPSIALERGAGIKYELIASVCIKGKRGVLRKDASSVLSSTAQIVIDKHELHQAWPIYCQPNSKATEMNNLTLEVTRGNTCYGPGDRVSVTATLKSDSFPTVVLRAFEFMLQETVMFRASPKAKKGGPLVRVTVIGEQKVPVNATMYCGMHHVAELGCMIPHNHTSTTVNSARHIDITYKIIVRAIMETGKPYIIEMPVIMSNWSRSSSIDAVRRIGYAPTLSLSSPPPGRPIDPIALGSAVVSQAQIPNPQWSPNRTAPQHRHRPSVTASEATSSRMSMGGFPPHVEAVQPPSTNGRLPAGYAGASTVGPSASTVPNADRHQVDEFGYHRRTNDSHARTFSAPSRSASSFATLPSQGPELRSTVVSSPIQLMPGRGAPNTQLYPLAEDSAPLHIKPDLTPTSPGTSFRMDDHASSRRGPLSAVSSTNRLTIANFNEDVDTSTPPPEAEDGPSAGEYRTAAEEKMALKRQWAENENLETAAVPVAGGSAANPPSAKPRKWESAEEEKRRMYNDAQARVAMTQGELQSSRAPAASIATTPSAVAAAKPNVARQQWERAEDEKRRLFEQAQAAVQRTQRSNWDATYETAQVLGDHRSSAGPASMASSTSGPSPARSAGAALYSHAMSSFNRQSTAPSEEPQPVIKPKPSGSGANQPQSERRHPTAEEEKAALRYHEAKRAVRQQGQPEPIPYEILYPAQDSSHVENYKSESTTTTHSSPTTQPNLHQTSLRAGSGSVNKDANSMASPLLSHHNGEESGNGSAGSSMHDDTDIRSQRVTTSRSRSGKGNTLPQPPSLPAGLTPGSSLPLTAAQEKARLKAQYDAEESRPVSSSPGNRQPGGQLRETFASAETMRRDPSISQGKKRALHDPNISPPPLPPRPPAEYLVETQMEDARTRAEEERLAAAMSNTSDNLPYDQSSIEASDLGSSDPGLSSANPPPLPPKVPIE